MPNWTCEIEGTSVVLLGNFNPSIFQPAWLAAHGLIRAEEAETAKIHVVHPQLSSFTAEWLTLQVTEDKFGASTSDVAHYEPLRDLVLGIFALLEHTPFSQMGINRQMHYKMPSEEFWDDFGHFLAPKAAWQDILVQPGLRSLTIQGLRKEIPDATMYVKVEPSVKVHFGVYIETNEHRETSGTDAAKKLMNTLKDSWQGSQAYAKRLAEHLLEQGSLHARRT